MLEEYGKAAEERRCSLVAHMPLAVLVQQLLKKVLHFLIFIFENDSLLYANLSHVYIIIKCKRCFNSLINTVPSDGILEELKEYQYYTQFAQDVFLQGECQRSVTYFSQYVYMSI